MTLGFTIHIKLQKSISQAIRDDFKITGLDYYNVHLLEELETSASELFLKLFTIRCDGIE